jgi:hypothetical protein
MLTKGLGAIGVVGEQAWPACLRRVGRQLPRFDA